MSDGELRAELHRAGVPERYSGATLEDCRVRVALEEYLAKLDSHLTNGRGLLLAGPVGTGKSSAAGIVCKEAVRLGKTIAWWYLPDLFQILGGRDWQSQDLARLTIQRSIGADLLVWDDFGVAGLPEWKIGLLDQIVEGRYRRDRPMLVTTNLSKKSLEDPALARLNDRWAERRFAIVISGESMRRTWRDEEGD